MSRFQKGQIVYFAKFPMGSKPFVWLGMFDEEYSDCIYIDLLHRPDTRVINGLPIGSFYSYTGSQSIWRKLPKGWTYNTPLFECVEVGFTEEQLKEYREADLKDPSAVMRLYNDGLLMKVKDMPTINFTPKAVIDKDKYRIVLKYCDNNGEDWVVKDVGRFFHQREYTVTDERVTMSNKYSVYATYAEAQAEVDQYLKEQEIAINMTEEEWALKEIKEVARLVYYNKKHPGKWINIIVDYFSKMPNLEGIEARTSAGIMQWRYFGKNRWNPLPEDLLYELERS